MHTFLKLDDILNFLNQFSSMWINWDLNIGLTPPKCAVCKRYRIYKKCKLKKIRLHEKNKANN